jgi:hypothetical protein
VPTEGSSNQDRLLRPSIDYKRIRESCYVYEEDGPASLAPPRPSTAAPSSRKGSESKLNLPDDYTMGSRRGSITQMPPQCKGMSRISEERVVGQVDQLYAIDAVEPQVGGERTDREYDCVPGVRGDVDTAGDSALSGESGSHRSPQSSVKASSVSDRSRAASAAHRSAPAPPSDGGGSSATGPSRAASNVTKAEALGAKLNGSHNNRVKLVATIKKGKAPSIYGKESSSVKAPARSLANASGSNPRLSRPLPLPQQRVATPEDGPQVCIAIEDTKPGDSDYLTDLRSVPGQGDDSNSTPTLVLPPQADDGEGYYGVPRPEVVAQNLARLRLGTCDPTKLETRTSIDFTSRSDAADSLGLKKQTWRQSNAGLY